MYTVKGQMQRKGKALQLKFHIKIKLSSLFWYINPQKLVLCKNRAQIQYVKRQNFEISFKPLHVFSILLGRCSQL